MSLHILGEKIKNQNCKDPLTPTLPSLSLRSPNQDIINPHEGLLKQIDGPHPQYSVEGLENSAISNKFQGDAAATAGLGTTVCEALV